MSLYNFIFAPFSDIIIITWVASFFSFINWNSLSENNCLEWNAVIIILLTFIFLFDNFILLFFYNFSYFHLFYLWLFFFLLFIFFDFLLLSCFFFNLYFLNFLFLNFNFLGFNNFFNFYLFFHFTDLIIIVSHWTFQKCFWFGRKWTF